jgi:tetratricopeptide (TPR) repeat protein
MRRNTTSRCALLCGLLCGLWALTAPAQEGQITGAATGPQAGRQQRYTAKASGDSEMLFYPSVGRRFHEIALELAHAKDPAPQQAEQAIVFFSAAVGLDSRAVHAVPEMIKLICRHSQQDHAPLVRELLRTYAGGDADLEVVTLAVRYLLDKLDSREQREAFLSELLAQAGGSNPYLASELLTLMGLLAAEKADSETARSYFLQAYAADKYNSLAIDKFIELADGQIEPAVYLEHLRLSLAKNPMDLQAAMDFAQYSERLGLYPTAAGAYGYCADLFSFLEPQAALPAYIYLPWAVSGYNTQRDKQVAVRLAVRLAEGGRSDLLLAAVAARAAEKTQQPEAARRMLEAAEKAALERYDSHVLSRKAAAGSRLAWFYCFALPDKDKAIDWANKAYAMDPNSPSIAGVLAYALVVNGQAELAQVLIDEYEHTQLMELALARIQLANNELDQAVETLKSAIEKDPGSLEAEEARRIISQNDRQYISPVSPEVVLAGLDTDLWRELVPTFAPPAELISSDLGFRGTKFSYGSDFGATFAITNRSAEKMAIRHDSLFAGHVRIDAEVRGDINQSFPELITFRIRPSGPINSGQTVLVPIEVATGGLRDILLNHPQASLEIEFTAYLDAVTDPVGNITNRLPGLAPARETVNRPRLELTSKFLRNRLNSLTSGRQGQKIKAARLFAGLLAEQKAMAAGRRQYRFMYADWMPQLLKSAIIKNLLDEDWVVKAHTMAFLSSVPLDFELVDALAKNIDEPAWPARMIAIYLLARDQGERFKKVLDHTARYDSSRFVREMALAMGAEPPPEE